MTDTQDRCLDIGCGLQKPPGFVGLDRFPNRGVDVVADLGDRHLPFADDSFDLILGFHSLEHVPDLLGAMREIWRVGKPGAQVVIAAPYATTHLNMANPYHLHNFNEHTPRFWTDAPTCPLDPAEWQQPPLGTKWGLASSDMSHPGFDLRTLRIEFFYFREFASRPPEEQRYARRHYMDVCEQILIHLAVFKPPLSEEDFENLEPRLYMPERLEQRRKNALGG